MGCARGHIQPIIEKGWRRCSIRGCRSMTQRLHLVGRILYIILRKCCRVEILCTFPSAARRAMVRVKGCIRCLEKVVLEFRNVYDSHHRPGKRTRGMAKNGWVEILLHLSLSRLLFCFSLDSAGAKNQKSEDRRCVAWQATLSYVEIITIC